MADITLCGALTRLKILNSLIKQYDGMPDLCMLNFFIDGHYQMLPLSWREEIKKSKIEEVGQLLNLDKAVKKDWPLSILCIRTLLVSFSIPRSENASIELASDKGRPHNLKKMTCMDHPKLRYLFIKNVKTKKRHEVSRMAEETVRLASDSKVKWVLDVGSGVGHLCRILAYGYGYNVCGVDIQDQLCERARKLDEELESRASKYLSEAEVKAMQLVRPVHYSATIGHNNTVATITKILQEAAKDTNCPDFGIVGLHPCGDLAVILLRAFVDCPKAKFINIVGCCYSKMDFSLRHHCGYPLSQTCASGDIYKMTGDAGSLGCHAIETYSSRLSDGQYDHLKIHCYRAALERIIVRRWPEYKRWGLSNVRHFPDLTFPEYCKKALEKLPLSVPQEDFDLPITQEDLKSWKEVVFFHSLWLLLGPAIESVFLLDRLIYLRERGISSRLKAIFDPVQSPRNQILCGIKES